MDTTTGGMSCSQCGKYILSGVYVNGLLCCAWCVPEHFRDQLKSEETNNQDGNSRLTLYCTKCKEKLKEMDYPGSQLFSCCKCEVEITTWVTSLKVEEKK